MTDSEDADTVALMRQVETLTVAVETRGAIGQAVGILAASLSLPTSVAWLVLRGLSNHTQVKVVDVARTLIAAHDDTLSDELCAISDAIDSILTEVVLRVTTAPRASVVQPARRGGSVR